VGGELRVAAAAAAERDVGMARSWTMSSRWLQQQTDAASLPVNLSLVTNSLRVCQPRPPPYSEIAATFWQLLTSACGVYTEARHVQLTATYQPLVNHSFIHSFIYTALLTSCTTVSCKGKR